MVFNIPAYTILRWLQLCLISFASKSSNRIGLLWFYTNGRFVMCLLKHKLNCSWSPNELDYLKKLWNTGRWENIVKVSEEMNRIWSYRYTFFFVANLIYQWASFCLGSLPLYSQPSIPADLPSFEEPSFLHPCLTALHHSLTLHAFSTGHAVGQWVNFISV